MKDIFVLSETINFSRAAEIAGATDFVRAPIQLLSLILQAIRPGTAGGHVKQFITPHREDFGGSLYIALVEFRDSRFFTIYKLSFPKMQELVGGGLGGGQPTPRTCKE